MKKILLSLGTLVAVITPVTMVLACSSHENNESNLINLKNSTLNKNTNKNTNTSMETKIFEKNIVKEQLIGNHRKDKEQTFKIAKKSRIKEFDIDVSRKSKVKEQITDVSRKTKIKKIIDGGIYKKNRVVVSPLWTIDDNVIVVVSPLWVINDSAINVPPYFGPKRFSNKENEAVGTVNYPTPPPLSS